MNTVLSRLVIVRAWLHPALFLRSLATLSLLLAASSAWAATQRQMGYLTLDQTSASPPQWHTVYFKTSFAGAQPVVIAGPASAYAGNQTTVRVRNVTLSSFEI